MNLIQQHAANVILDVTEKFLVRLYFPDVRITMFMIRTRTRTNYHNLAQPAWPFPAQRGWEPWLPEITLYLAQPVAPYPNRYRSKMPCQLITTVMPSTYGMMELQKVIYLN
jgi:hypothetical protein